MKHKLLLIGSLAAFLALNAQAQTSGAGTTPANPAGQTPVNPAGQTPVPPPGMTPMNPAGQTPTTAAAGRLGVSSNTVGISGGVTGLGTNPFLLPPTQQFGIVSNPVNAPITTRPLFTRTNRQLLFPTARSNAINPMLQNP